MPSMRQSVLAIPVLQLLVAAVPAPAPAAQQTAPGQVVPRSPLVTAAPNLEGRSPDILDDVGSYVNSVLSDLGSDISSFVASGIPQFFQDFPVGSEVQDELGVSDEELDAKPTEVLNLPSYGNWTEDGWNVRARGNVYKRPDISRERLDDLANIFLIDVDIQDLEPSQQEQARNVTSQIFVIQQEDVTVTMNYVVGDTFESDKDGGAIAAAGGAQHIQLPDETTDQGDFDVFVKLVNTTGPEGGYMLPGAETTRVQTLKMFANGMDTGNATVYLVPPEGVTIISDIDDILRITKIYDPEEGLLNSFARKFVPWAKMPEIYAAWATAADDLHFHYLTTTPEQITRTYMEYIYSTYPLGSFDTRPLNFSDVSATLSIRRYLLDRVFQTFPQRRFVLVGDTTNSDVMKAYPDLYKDHSSQVSCILLRNTSATDSTNRFPYDTSGFEGIPRDRYMFFRTSDDLVGIDVPNGGCYNESVQQNVTFGYQGLPWDDSGSSLTRPSFLVLVLGIVAVFLNF